MQLIVTDGNCLRMFEPTIPRPQRYMQ